jgi:antitoxin component YwqK of YwqJK toxin-antitoxin module
MTHDMYQVKDHQLIIQDAELGLNLTLSFFLPQLPQDLSQNQSIDEGYLLVTERDETQALRAAFLSCKGKRHGQCRLYYPSGKVEAEMFYQMDKLHGPSCFYGENGEVLSRTFFCEGKREGKVYFYYLSGKVASVQRFKGGVWHGVQEYFYEDGSVKSLLPYSHGKLHGEVRLFWEGGKSKRITCYDAGMRNGKDQIWNEKGTLLDDAEYRLGQPFGTHSHYFPSGKLKEEVLYHAPTRFDKREWNDEGKLLIEGIWSEGLNYTEKTYLESRGATVRKGYWDGNRLCWK